VSETTYTPAGDLEPNPAVTYTWEELRDLLDHWGIDDELRELSDGTVIDAAWDPSDCGEPTVYAQRDLDEGDDGGAQ